MFEWIVFLFFIKDLLYKKVQKPCIRLLINNTYGNYDAFI